MSDWVRQNLSLFLLSLLLAFFFWAVATESEDPTQINALNTPITVEVRGLPDGMIATGVQNARVQVEIRAPESVWNRIRAEGADAVEAYIDLTGVTTGTVEAPVRVEVGPQPSEVTRKSPETIELTVEQIAEKEVPVNVRVQGSPAVGFSAETHEVAPQSIRVRGPESQVVKVARADISVSIEGRQNDLRGDYEPIPVTEDGDTVARVDVTPESVTVNIPIVQLGFYRDIPVLTGPLLVQPAPGYRISDIEYFPQVVKVVGRTDLVQSVQFLQTEPITLEGITQTVTTQVDLQTPPGVSLLQPASPVVTVTLSVEVIRSGLTLEITPTIRGLAPGLTADVGPDVVVVILSGPFAVMDEVVPEDIDVILDLSGYRPGEYTIVPEVTVPPQIDFKLTPEEVPVQITEVEEEEEPTRLQ